MTLVWMMMHRRAIEKTINSLKNTDRVFVHHSTRVFASHTQKEQTHLSNHGAGHIAVQVWGHQAAQGQDNGQAPCQEDQYVMDFS